MPQPKFLYGSHYSTPGYVLYYLVRVGKTVLEFELKFLDMKCHVTVSLFLYLIAFDEVK